MKHYVIYDNTTGVVEQSGTVPAFNFVGQQPADVSKGLLESASQSVTDYYVDVSATPHVVRQKQAMALTTDNLAIAADGVAVSITTGIPNPSTVFWPDGTSDQVTTGQVSFSVDLAGDYALRFESLAFLIETVDITAA